MTAASRQMAFQLGELPQGLRPMLAYPAGQPFDAPGWLFEGLWGGLRVLAFVAEGRVKLRTGAGRDVTGAFGELAQAVADAARVDGLVVEGEVVARDRRGAPRFSLIARRLEADSLAGAPLAATFHVSDILYQGYQSVLRTPLSRRRQLLRNAIAPSDTVQHTHHQERWGVSFYEAAVSLGLEGVVARQASSLYYPATRSTRWLTVREKLTADLVVGGYTVGDERSGELGSLLLGAFDGDAFLHVASVAGGFPRDERAGLLDRLAGLQTGECPFFDPPDVPHLLYWSRPSMAVRVDYGELASNGRPRFAVYRSVRPDVDPSSCTVDAMADRLPARAR